VGFPSDLLSFSIKLPSTRHEKIRVTIFTGLIFIFIAKKNVFFLKTIQVHTYK